MNPKKAGLLLVIASVVITLVFVSWASFRKSPAKTLFPFPAKQKKIVVVYLTGPISFEAQGSLFYNSTTEETRQILERIAEDDTVQAVVLRINSPGGSAAASQELHQLIQQIRKTGKKVVASFGDIAASGGYYVGVAADRIVAQPATITGSIGVITTVPNLEELYAKIGYKEQVFKSGAHKDMLSPARPVTEEEKRIIQGIINETYKQFLEAVAKGRNMPLEEVQKLADGRIFTGSQAKELGLVDQLGGLQEAVALAAKLAGIKGKPRVVYYRNAGLLKIFSDLTARIALSQLPATFPLPRGYIMVNY
jgi:protease-4